MRYLTIALSKGRLTELSIDLFEAIGIDCSELRSSSRKLILADEKKKIKFSVKKQHI
jgi:ATP phosphoribosyltransferase